MYLPFTALLLLFASMRCLATPDTSYISRYPGSNAFPLSVNQVSAPVYASEDDFPGVLRAAKDLQHDIAAVTNKEPVFTTAKPSGKQVVLIGTIGKSSLIDHLIAMKKLDVGNIKGKWETFLIMVIDKPMPGVDRALVIAGSDKRGTIYGIYDLSAQIGVSPWYYWADVPIPHQDKLYVLAGRHSRGEPAVKYRGIFINDEAPAFSGWARQKFGGLNHVMYAKMFELILRLKGNYLWPAMWGNAFNDDDPLNRKTADDYGIVMGTSHHEPMDRAQQEWKRYGTGAWDYNKNGEVLRDFWRKGIENMGNAETIVTVGMRGDGDMAMTEGTNIALLEKIVADQRNIIASVTGKPAERTPQLWALYKEVQEYYDQGMRVPDDITLLLCDDNWGNIRKLPAITEKPRRGGYGIYYHFDYVGGPRNYKWINTNPITKVWEQMHLAYQHHVNQVWIVNVGDLKPMEFPISFFLDYAWNPDKIGANDLQKYTINWAEQQFGKRYAAQIARILSTYTKYNGRRKPELLNERTYSLTNYNEFERVVSEYRQLNVLAGSIYKQISPEYKDAYYELILHPVSAMANLYEMYYTVALNRLYAQQGRAATNETAGKANDLFLKDAEISKYYNTQLAGGKWSHMMDQTHIGYTSWQEPRTNIMPEVTKITVPNEAALGVAVEGSTDWWPRANSTPRLPQFDNLQNSKHFIELFNHGTKPVSYKIEAPGYIKLDAYAGKIDKQRRIWVSIDWQKLPAGKAAADLKISGSDGTKVTVGVNLVRITPGGFKGFIQTDPYVSIEATHYQKAIAGQTYHWMLLPDYGRTASAMTLAYGPAPVKQPVNVKPHLEYAVKLADTGTVTISTYLAPTIDFTPDKSLRYAVSIDDELPRLMPVNADLNPKVWDQAVSGNINIITTSHHVTKAGPHIIKVWMESPGAVLEKIVLGTGEGVKPSYLGPPESFRR
ncbi:glycosyl hydrolase 115 family protein [Mucilaginibacter boryungensis]|uniref:glycosyl hydrolase 115 family protein n=1 Tax=Mucilaginibacter boryungensis TaxID=768480 RepID=UPI00366E41F8